MTVFAVTPWSSNAHLIADVARLGYLDRGWPTLDPTYGNGTWWQRFRPHNLVTHDLALDGVDFRHLPHEDGEFQAVAFDPPYKLNGTPTAEVDGRYGVDVIATAPQRHDLMLDGMTECERVLASRGYLLVKCQDQVSSGHVHWQADMVSHHAATLGLIKVDALHMMGGRAQPAGTRQVHARRNYSTLLVLRKH